MSKIFSLQKVAGAGRVGGGEKSQFTPVRIHYPAMTIGFRDRIRLLGVKELKAAGWNAEKLWEFLLKAYNVVERLKGLALGRYPNFSFYIGLEDKNHPEKALVLAPLRDRNEKRFTFLFANGRDSEFVLEHTERLLCEHIGQALLYHSPEAALRLQDPAAFINGIEDNPFLSGMRIKFREEFTMQLAAGVGLGNFWVREDRDHFVIQFKRGCSGETLLKVIASKCEELVRAKISEVLFPDVRLYSKEAARNRIERDVATVWEVFTNGGNIEVAIIILAHLAAILEIREFPDLAAGIEKELQEKFVKAEAEKQLLEEITKVKGTFFSKEGYLELQKAAERNLQQKAMDFLNAVKTAYLDFCEGIKFKRA